MVIILTNNQFAEKLLHYIFIHLAFRGAGVESVVAIIVIAGGYLGKELDFTQGLSSKGLQVFLAVKLSFFGDF